MNDRDVNLSTLDHFPSEKICLKTGLGNLLRKVYARDQIIGHKVTQCKKNFKKGN